MVIEALLQKAADRLAQTENPTPRLDAAVLLCHVLGRDRGYLITHNREEVPQRQAEAYLAHIERREQKVPVAYLTGSKEFMSLAFAVNEHVLIPRADTETLCEFVLEQTQIPAPKIADLCCGSGCIGISLAVYIPDSQVVLADVSGEAVKIAAQNAKKHKVDSRCRVLQTDLLNDTVEGSFDLVVSNPPYIETDVIGTLAPDVADYEPRLALDGGTDGLTFYRRLAQTVPVMLRQGGLLALEVGHTQAQAVAGLLEKDFTDIKQVRDLAGIARVVSGRRK